MKNQLEIVIGADHAGFLLKEFLKEKLNTEGFEVIDIGAQSQDSVDYPLYAEKLCQIVKEKDIPGILICGSGIGMSIAANRFNGINAALCFNTELAKLAKQHNKANVLVLGAKFVTNEEAYNITKTWQEAKFLGDRHQRRVEQIDKLNA